MDDPFPLLTRQLLRERLPDLVAETCAWSVGLSDRPHLVRRGHRLVADGTLASRTLAGLPLGDDDAGRLELADQLPGTFGDALNAVADNGQPHADTYEHEVLEPFVLDTCVRAGERAAAQLPHAWAELLDELGENGTDLAAVVRAAEWEAPMRIEAGHLVLAALGGAPLVQVEAEGLPLSLVRAAEAELAAAAPAGAPLVDERQDLAGALFLAQAALTELTTPVPPAGAGELLEALEAEGLEPGEVLAVLTELPVLADTVEEVWTILAARPPRP